MDKKILRSLILCLGMVAGGTRVEANSEPLGSGLCWSTDEAACQRWGEAKCQSNFAKLTYDGNCASGTACTCSSAPPPPNVYPYPAVPWTYGTPYGPSGYTWEAWTEMQQGVPQPSPYPGY